MSEIDVECFSMLRFEQVLKYSFDIASLTESSRCESLVSYFGDQFAIGCLDNLLN